MIGDGRQAATSLSPGADGTHVRIFESSQFEGLQVERAYCTRFYCCHRLAAKSNPTLCNPMDCITPGCPDPHHLPELAQVHVHWVDDAIQPSHPLSPISLLALKLPWIRVFSNESTLRIRWPNYWNFNFSISPSKEYSGLISFRIDWFDLLAVQETLKSLLQHHSSKASILWCSAFFMTQLSHPYITTGKIIALTIWLCPQSDASVF